LTEQVETEKILFDLTLASFEPLTPGSGGNVVEKKEKLASPELSVINQLLLA
jgi:hypothetical protein